MGDLTLRKIDSPADRHSRVCFNFSSRSNRMFTDKQRAPPITARFSNSSAIAGSRQGGDALRVLKGHRPRDTTSSSAPLPLRAYQMDAAKEMDARRPLVDRPVNTLKSGNAVATPAAAVEPPRQDLQVGEHPPMRPLPAQQVHNAERVQYQPDAVPFVDRGQQFMQQQQLMQQQQRPQALPASRTANSPTKCSRIPQHVCTHNVPYDLCKLRKLHLKGIAAEMEACFEQFAEADGPELLQELQKESRRLVEIRNALSEACKGDADAASQRTSYGGDGLAQHRPSQLQLAHEQPFSRALVSSLACNQPPPQPQQMHQTHPTHQVQPSFQMPHVHQYPRGEQGQLNEYNQQTSFQHPPVEYNGYHQPEMPPSFQQPPMQQQSQQQRQNQHHQQQYSAFGDVGAQDLPPPALLPSAQPAEFQSNPHDRVDASNDPTWKRTDFEWSQVRWPSWNSFHIHIPLHVRALLTAPS